MIFGSEQLYDAPLAELKTGFREQPDSFSCLICSAVFEKGIIYQNEGVLYDARRYIRFHIQQEHGSVFEQLVSADKKITGLSEHQSKLLQLFYNGISDSDIQKQLSIGSASTIRNHRFALREKERQAKVFLALMELLKETDRQTPLVTPHSTATQLDDRYYTTEPEAAKILKTYFPNGPSGLLTTFSMKEKLKLIILRQLATRFAPGHFYSEKSVNAILKTAHADYATIRRYLVEYGFLDRKADGSEYWLKKNLFKGNESTMDRRKELTREYKEKSLESGIYQIHNTINDKKLIVAATDLKTINGKRFQLQMGGHMNKELQADWNKYGETAFEFEVLEKLKEQHDPAFDKKTALKALEKKWLEKLQPFDEQGYNKRKIIRKPR